MPAFWLQWIYSPWPTTWRMITVLYFIMPSRNSKCSSCGKPKEATLLNAVLEQLGSPTDVPVCQHVTMLLSLNQYLFTPVSACQLTGSRQIALKTQTSVTTAIASQPQGEKRQPNLQNVISAFTCPEWKSQDIIMRNHSGWYWNTCNPILKPPHPQRTPTISTPWLTPPYLAPIFDP